MRRYRMKAVSRLTGVRPELLRMWERRYRLFKPGRANNRYREFDDEDVQLLLYIRQQIDQGRTIGELAAEGREALLRRLAPAPAAAIQDSQEAALLEELLQYLQHLDKAVLKLGWPNVPCTALLQRCCTPSSSRSCTAWEKAGGSRSSLSPVNG
jgi:DNA-binding transcriptional MerR regulator